MMRRRFSRLVVLAVLALPAVAGILPGHADAQEKGKVVKLNAGRATKFVALKIASFQLTDKKLGEKAPAGTQFVIVKGFLKNRSKKEKLTFPDVAQAFFIFMRNGYAPLHQLSADTTQPFWGSLKLSASEQRPFEAVFIVPDGPIEAATLVQTGTTLGTMTVPLIASKKKRKGRPLAGPVKAGEAEITVFKSAFTRRVGNFEAPKGWHFLDLELSYVNRHKLQPLYLGLSAFTLLVEDGQHIYEPSPVTAAVSPHLAQEFPYMPALPVEGRLVFMVPEETGDLILVHVTEKAQLRLDLTAKLEPPAKPVIIAGPIENKRLRLELYDAVRWTKAPAPQDRYYLRVDLGLHLIVDKRTTTLHLDPRQRLVLRDQKGKIYEPAPVGSALRRPFFPVNLWPNLPLRGEAVFAIPATTAPESLVVEFRDLDRVLTLKVPGAAAIAKVKAKTKPIAETTTASKTTPVERSTLPDTPRFFEPMPPGDEPVNVVLKKHLPIVRTWRYPERLSDGRIDKNNYTAAKPGEPMAVYLLQPYAIDRVRFYLWDFDKRALNYLFEGSPDGKTWSVIADKRNELLNGWQEFDLEGKKYRAFRVTGTKSTHKKDDVFYLAEFEAYTRDPVPTVGTNLAFFANGGELVHLSATHKDKRWHPASGLNDGSFGNYAWWSEPAKKGQLVAPHDLVFAFHGNAPVVIGAVVLGPGAVNNDPKLRTPNPRKIEVWVSNKSPTDGFIKVGSYEFDDDWKPQLAKFRPVEARYVKIRLLDNHGHPVIAVKEVEIYEVPVAGRTALLDQRRIEFQDRKKLTGPQATALRREGRNLALALHGGRVVRVKGADVKVAAQLLNNGSANWRSDMPLVKPYPVEAVFGFFDGQEALVDQVNIFTRKHYHPMKLQILSTRGGPDGPFEPIGPIRYFTQNWAWHVIKFPPRRMRHLMVRVLKGYHPDKTTFNEIQVIEASAPGYKSILEPPEYPDFQAGPNIALAALGGSIVSAPKLAIGGWQATNLIDGTVTDGRGWLTKSHGYTTKAGVKYPVDLVFAFNQKRAARLSAFAVDPTNRTGNKGGFDSSPYGTVGDRPRVIEFWVSKDTPDGPWSRIGGEYQLRSRAVRQLFTFDQSVEARYVRIRVLSNFAGRAVQLGEVELYETPHADGHKSVLRDFEPNILDPALGGALVRATSQGSYYSEHYIAGHVLEPADKGKLWRPFDYKMPQRLLFNFRKFKVALIDRVEIEISDKTKKQNWPRTVKISGTNDISPFGDYKTFGQFTVEPDKPVQVFKFDEPVEARYLEVAILEGVTKNAWVNIDRIRVFEAKKEGYVSVVNNPGRGAKGDKALGSEQETALAADRQETEPNNTPQQAMAIALDETVGGAIDPQPDIDRYDIDLTRSEKKVVNLRLKGAPFIKSFLTLKNAKGDEVFSFDPAAASKDEFFTLRLDPDKYQAKLFEPTTSVVLVFDNSGSMGGSVQALKQAAIQYIEARAAHEEMALVKFSNKVQVLHDFTSDSEALKKAVAGKLVASGGTALYDGLKKALELLADRKGNRAIVLMSDGADSSSKLPYAELWKAIEKAGVRVYTVALGSALNVHFKAIGTTPSNMMKTWSIASGGRLFFAPTSDKLLTLYDRISKELRATPRYTIAAHVPSGEGDLHVLETGERIKSVAAPKQIELILDASGSMRGKTKDGVTKMTAAKKVMRTMISNLPDDVQVGLRVYGHRYDREPKKRSCTDSQLVVPFGPVNKAALRKAVNAIQPKGQTPIGLSLKMLEHDLGKAKGQKLIVLVTDGIETCAERPSHADYPPTVVRRLLDKGLKVRVNIVGFDIGANRTRRFLADLAGISGGSYHAADNTQELEAALLSAMQVPYSIEDAIGNKVAEGVVGAPLPVPDGRYTVKVASTEPLIIEDVVVEPGRATRVFLNKEGDEVGVEKKIVARDAALPPGARAVAAVPAGPVAAPPKPQSREERVAALLEEAQVLFDEKQLTTPKGVSALDRFEEVLALDPGNAAGTAGVKRIAATYAGWADGAMKGGKPAKAVRYYRKAIEVDPDAPVHHADLGAALRRSGQLGKAEKSYRRALELDKANAAAKRGLAEIDKARQVARRAAKPAVAPKTRAVTKPLAPEIAAKPPAKAPQPTPKKPPAKRFLAGSARVLNTATLVVQGTVVRLVGIRGESGPAARNLAQYIGRREVRCELQRYPEYKCFVGGFDLSQVVLFNGGGRATADAPAYLKSAAAKARAARVGVWR